MRPLTRFLIAGVLAGIVYSFFATYGRFEYPRDPYHRYELQAAGYLKGQLNLAVDPPPALLTLPDPYDHEQNEKLRLHDVSFFHGKYYLYFGPAPALLAFVPYHLLTGSFPPDALVITVFCSLAFAFLSLILLDIMDRMPRRMPPASRALLLCALAMGNGVPFLLARTEVYEVAISCGFFFTSLAVYLLYRILVDRVTMPRALGLSLAIGLAASSRPHFALLSLLCPALWLFIHSRQKAGWRIAAALGGPVAACGALLALHNYARFGKLTEFGINYQLAGFNIRNNPFFPADLGVLFQHLRAGLYLYLFEGMVIHGKFPFFSANTHLPVSLQPDSLYFVEPVYGILNSNFLVLPAIAGIVILVRAVEKPLRPFRPFQVFVSALVLIVLLTLCSGLGITARYLVDFAGCLGLLLSIIILGARAVLLGRAARIYGIATDVTAGLVVIIGFFLGLQGYHDDFRAANPDLFHRIENATHGKFSR